MPKFAATLASLLLIASSIGVNIARYFQVGRTVYAGQPTETAETGKFGAGGAAVKSRRNGPSGTIPRPAKPQPGRRNCCTGCRSCFRGRITRLERIPRSAAPQPGRRSSHPEPGRCRSWTCGRWSPRPVCRRLRAWRIRRPVLTRCGGFHPRSRPFPRLPIFRLREARRGPAVSVHFHAVRRISAP